MFPIILASIGMLCGIVGSVFPMLPAQKWLFLANAFLMTPLPLVRKDTMLSALQVVSIVGAVVGAVTMTKPLQYGLPIGTAAVAVGFLWWSGDLCNWRNRIGSCGIAALATGYATQNPIIYLIGGLVLCVYTWLAFKDGQKIALLWFTLNGIFVFTSIWAVVRDYGG